MSTVEDEFIAKNPNYIKSLGNDLPAGLVVFLVALPLCLGIALASDAPIYAGIIAGIVGGVVVGLLSGSPLGVSGPAAGLAVVVADAIKSFEKQGFAPAEAFEVFLLAVFISGILQLILGMVKAGIIGYYFPSSVIKGMLAGIGVILILKQIPHALGKDTSNEGILSFADEIDADGEVKVNTFTAIRDAFETYNIKAVIICLVCLGIILLWDKVIVKKIPLLKVVPGALLAVLAGVFINTHFLASPTIMEFMSADSFKSFMNAIGLDMGVGSLQNTVEDGIVTEYHLVHLPDGEDFFKFPDFSQIGNWLVWKTAGTIAIVASLETLLCVEATDKLDPYKRVTPTNRELRAQGIGNLVSGLIGGLPITQVIVRSSANIDANGKTKVSAIFHGGLLALCIYLIPDLLVEVPLASLAAILLLVGYKLARVSLFVSMYEKGMSQFIPFVVTIVAIVFSDLLTGIAIGGAVAIFFILRSNYHTPFYYKKEEHHQGEKFTIRLSEEVSFLNKASIMIMLEELPENCSIIIDGRNSNMIDLDVIEIIENFIAHAPLRNINVDVIGIDGIQQDQLERRFRLDTDFEAGADEFRER